MHRGNADNRFSRRQAMALAASHMLCLLAGARAARGSAPAVRFNMSFDRDRFVEDCVVAGRERDAQAAVREVLSRAVSEPAGVLARLGAGGKAGIDVMHRSPHLTIFAAHWAPQMSLPAHDHRMWALIGVFAGREDNIHWHRTVGRLQAHGAAVLFPGDVAALPADAIHSVTNPLTRFTSGIHIYGGDFFATPRSQWDPESLVEAPSDGAAIRAMFERENQRLACQFPG
jgi:predicted metal-dependent enzyme (double-stranded beta helix superfamily)